MATASLYSSNRPVKRLCASRRARYPALHRLEEERWILAAWGVTESNRKARFYSLTAAGRKQLNAELVNWKRLTAGVGKVLSFA